MKKLLMILAITLSLGFANAQAGIAKIKGNTETFDIAVKQGYFEFKMPETTSEKELSKTIGYYKDYFIVRYSPKTRIAQVTMLDNTTANRLIIQRFLISNKIDSIILNDEKNSLQDFFAKHM